MYQNLNLFNFFSLKNFQTLKYLKQDQEYA